MSYARYLIGDVLERLATLPDDSVDLIFSSPPFLALRSYLPDDHPEKSKEIGSEPTPGDFIDALLDVTEACSRVLAPHGTLCFELGDTYSGSGESGWERDAGEYRSETRSAASAAGLLQQKRGKSGYPRTKSLCMVPESYRWALSYGRNPFTGRTTDQWIVRNVVRWFRPNPPVGALGDKFRPATSDVAIATKSSSRYFDIDAVRTPPVAPSGTTSPNNAKGADALSFRFSVRVDSHPGGVPPLDTWLIPTEPYAGSHYATFPTALVVQPVRAMCPQQVCTVCGQPSRRIVDDPIYVDAKGEPIGERRRSPESYGRGGHPSGDIEVKATRLIPNEWTDCGHNAWRRGVVLDPFAGSGTVLSVATGHGRDAIGIDIDERNASLARDRIGDLFITIEYPEEAVA